MQFARRPSLSAIFIPELALMVASAISVQDLYSELVSSSNSKRSRKRSINRRQYYAMPDPSRVSLYLTSAIKSLIRAFECINIPWRGTPHSAYGRIDILHHCLCAFSSACMPWGTSNVDIPCSSYTSYILSTFFSHYSPQA